MKGTVLDYKGSWFVRWYDSARKRDVKIYHYKGIKLESRRMAEKLLATMQSDYENGTFYLDKYLKKGFSDVIPFIESWLKNAEDLSPATYKGYRSYVKNHIRPFFEQHSQLSLPDVQLDVLERLRRDLKAKGLFPKTQINIMYCMHLILDEAKRARKINTVPSFPRKKKYQHSRPVIKWLPESRQLHIIEQIPEDHQPIFFFLKYHLRRPAEACAIQKQDYQDGVFTICRSVSARKIQAKTKTGEIHTIPCHPDFETYLDMEVTKQKRYRIFSPFLFVNPLARRPGKRYTGEALNIIWKKACDAAGENIDLYSGLKHSSCSQYINEKGLSESELQIITDHARIDSVRAYARTEVKQKRDLMSRTIQNYPISQNGNDK
ncbi:MAG: site-specific integrase [Desulfotignum sp.]|nr:site-specific integrase [Desulfotignum sp.]MCF8125544.1 site-specific integrase [Desulfotignum sp.]